jgi:hypothetical protein
VNRLQDLRSLCVVPSVCDLSLKDNSLSSLHGIHALPQLTHLLLDINQVGTIALIEKQKFFVSIF